jgi:hypothetical protein
MGCTYSTNTVTPPPRTNRTNGNNGNNSTSLTPSLNGNPHNRRVKAVPSWLYDNGPITHSNLNNRRQVFWEAQTSGRRIIWENLKVISEAMLAGNIELANTLLDAADIRVPHSDLSVCYDSLGQLYQVPRYAYSTPINVITDEEAAAIANSTRKEHIGPIVDVPLVLRIGPTPSNMEQDIKLTFKSNTTIKEVKLALHETLMDGTHDIKPDSNNTKPNKWIGKGLSPYRQRIMYCGRELPDNNHLQEARVEPHTFLQIFIRPE